MKKIILSIIAISLSFGVCAQNLSQADSVWTAIKNEKVRGANTDTRVGGAGNAIIAGIRDTLANFVSDGSALSLGETDVTAYRGDRGKVAYDFAIGILDNAYIELNSIKTKNGRYFYNYQYGANIFSYPLSEQQNAIKISSGNIGIWGGGLITIYCSCLIQQRQMFTLLFYQPQQSNHKAFTPH